MKIKIVVWSVVLIFVLVVVSGAVWWELRPQVITFDDGSKVTLVAVDYGKKHTSPGPTKHSFNTPTNTLVIWVRQQHDPNEYANFQYYIYDKAGTACVMGQYGYYGNNRRGANDVVGVQFPAFPRREGRFYVRIQEFGNGGQELSDQKFSLSNPAHGSFSSLSPQPLPETEQDGDMTVTLKKLVSGAKMPYNRGGDDDDDAMDKAVQTTFNVQINGTNATMWEPISFEMTDATGNHVNAMISPRQSQQIQTQGNDVVATYQYGLWPDEPAWKLRVEFSKQSGFADNELWTVQGIPLDPGKQNDFWNFGRKQNNATNVFAEGDVDGLHVKIYRARYFTDMPPNSNPQGGLSIEVDPSLPEGTRMTLVKLTDDQTNDINYWDAGWNGGRKAGGGTIYHYSLQDVNGATNLNLTLAVHKSHYLEFTAKPQIAAADSSDQSNQQ
ncbi:MAG TPA: hypothetical protein VMH87_13585 [Pseudomonadales bacterium]|nr:hypothetical protein [Pseudomonadales bacterium]